MTTIQLKTEINAPIERVFDLSRSIDFHIQSVIETKEQAIDGTTTGLISYGETVTWRGKHFGLFLKHTSKIVHYERPFQFTDVMIKGHFMYFGHQHFFNFENQKTTMIDILKYRTPFGIFGRIFDKYFLNRHLTQFLKKRNKLLKIEAEKSKTSYL
ncbi:MAG: SRPBCC family protein [Flavobacteriaceae bacterium]|nr:SRPBCC family protein [Flavobacteriaceae bacterium]